MFLFKWWWPSAAPTQQTEPVPSPDVAVGPDPASTDGVDGVAVPEVKPVDPGAAEGGFDVDRTQIRPYFQELKQCFEREDITQRAENVVNKGFMCHQISRYLDRISWEQEKAAKVTLVLELFDLLASDQGRNFIRSQPTFGKTVFRKLHEMHRAREIDFAWHYNRIFPRHCRLYPLGSDVDHVTLAMHTELSVL